MLLCKIAIFVRQIPVKSVEKFLRDSIPDKHQTPPKFYNSRDIKMKSKFIISPSNMKPTSK